MENGIKMIFVSKRFLIPVEYTAKSQFGPPTTSASFKAEFILTTQAFFSSLSRMRIFIFRPHKLKCACEKVKCAFGKAIKKTLAFESEFSLIVLGHIFFVKEIQLSFKSLHKIKVVTNNLCSTFELLREIYRRDMNVIYFTK